MCGPRCQAPQTIPGQSRVSRCKSAEPSLPDRCGSRDIPVLSTCRGTGARHLETSNVRGVDKTRRGWPAPTGVDPRQRLTARAELPLRACREFFPMTDPPPPAVLKSDGSLDLGAIPRAGKDRKSTRLNSSHRCISYAVFCL